MMSSVEPVPTSWKTTSSSPQSWNLWMRARTWQLPPNGSQWPGHVSRCRQAPCDAAIALAWNLAASDRSARQRSGGSGTTSLRLSPHATSVTARSCRFRNRCGSKGHERRNKRNKRNKRRNKRRAAGPGGQRVLARPAQSSRGRKSTSARSLGRLPLSHMPFSSRQAFIPTQPAPCPHPPLS